MRRFLAVLALSIVALSASAAPRTLNPDDGIFARFERFVQRVIHHIVPMDGGDGIQPPK